MKKANRKLQAAGKAEYDFSRGVRGKYARRYAQGSNVVVLEPDVAKVFTNSEAVNRSLRTLAGIAKSHRKRSSSRFSTPAVVREKPTKKYSK